WILGMAVGIDAGFFFWAVVLPLTVLGSVIPVGIGMIGPQDVTIAAIAQILGREVEPFLLASVLLHAVRIAGSLPGTLCVNDITNVLRVYGRHRKGARKMVQEVR